MHSERPRGVAGTVREQWERDPAIICALDEQLRITYCNPSWDRFAEANGGQGLRREQMTGHSYMKAIPVALQQFFEEGFARTLERRQVWEHDYECSSPETYRRFRMTAFPEPGGPGVVVVNSLVVERPHEAAERQAVPGDVGLYVDWRGHITMCCHCRRTCRNTEPMTWDWVPEYLRETPAPVSHSICTPCMTIYYPDYVEQ